MKNYFLAFALAFLGVLSSQTVMAQSHLTVDYQTYPVPDRLTGINNEVKFMEVTFAAEGGDVVLDSFYVVVDSAAPLEYTNIKGTFKFAGQYVTTTPSPIIQYFAHLSFKKPHVLRDGQSLTVGITANMSTARPESNTNDVWRIVYAKSDADIGTIQGSQIEAMDKAFLNENNYTVRILANGQVVYNSKEDPYTGDEYIKVSPPDFGRVTNSKTSKINIPPRTSNSVSQKPETEKLAFLDVAVTHPHQAAIRYVKDQSIVKGYDDGKFKPDNTITRAEFIKIVIGASYSQDEISTCSTGVGFSDVSSDQWYVPYLCVAVERGIIKGYDDGTFRPGNPIAFTEAAKIIAIVQKGKLPTDEVWYRPYVRFLQDESAIPTEIAALASQLSRGQMAELIYRLNAKVKNKPSKSFDL